MRFAKQAFAAALLVAVVAACAKREPPSGGPPDLEPPRILETAPDSGASKVGMWSPISITFSEGMEPRSTEDAIEVSPFIPIAKRRWSGGGRTLTLQFAEPMRANHTYTISVAGSARDRHGNIAGPGATLVVSTADSFPPGRIAGMVEGRGLAAEDVALWCYDAAKGRVPDSTARDFDAIGFADRDGVFRIDGLGIPGRYHLWAFADLNHNRSFEPASDVLAAIDTTVELTAARPVLDSLAIRVVNPRASGRAKGTVIDSLADTVGVIRVLAVAERDTMFRVMDTPEADGAFELELDPGAWMLRAFRDHDRDQIWDPEDEPWSDRIRIEIEPAGDVIEIKLTLRPPPG